MATGPGVIRHRKSAYPLPSTVAAAEVRAARLETTRAPARGATTPPRAFRAVRVNRPILATWASSLATMARACVRTPASRWQTALPAAWTWSARVERARPARVAKPAHPIRIRVTKVLRIAARELGPVWIRAVRSPMARLAISTRCARKEAAHRVSPTSPAFPPATHAMKARVIAARAPGLASMWALPSPKVRPVALTKSATAERASPA